MTSERSRRHNIQHLLDLAQTYKGLSRKKLAESLGRDPTKLAPETGNPKLDYIIRLADLLDWPVGDVADVIWDHREEPRELPTDGFEQANEAARAAHQQGEYTTMLEAARAMRRLAQTAEQGALAALRESGAWDGMGRHTKQLEAVRRGLQESGITTDLRFLLQVNLANTYYLLGQSLEARAMARDLIEEFGACPPESRSSRAAEAFAHYVHGHACRGLMAQQPDRGPFFARSAKESLERSVGLYLPLAEEFDNPVWRGVANTCAGGLIEVEVELGARQPDEAVAELLKGLDAAVNPRDGLVGDALESYGWWCVFGCNIGLRHLKGGDLQRHVSVFVARGCEIAERLGNWAMRERLFTMEFARRQLLNELAGMPLEWTIDSEQVRVIVGTMGRFPRFKSTGWKILRSATIVGNQ